MQNRSLPFNEIHLFRASDLDAWRYSSWPLIWMPNRCHSTRGVLSFSLWLVYSGTSTAGCSNWKQMFNSPHVYWLVAWNIFFSIIYGIVLPIVQYFSRWFKPPTRYIYIYILIGKPSINGPFLHAMLSFRFLPPGVIPSPPTLGPRGGLWGQTDGHVSGLQPKHSLVGICGSFQKKKMFVPLKSSWLRGYWPHIYNSLYNLYIFFDPLIRNQW